MSADAEKLARLVPLARAAKLAGCRYYAIREMVEHGKLPAYRRGERILLVDPEEVPGAVLAASRYVPAAAAAKRKPGTATNASRPPLNPAIDF
ncbi:MAG: hypothetical protein JWO31_2631 [Phycisphaerales bacterium]|nr:hypothetical protein [Phycisphaerales bacterium]